MFVCLIEHCCKLLFELNQSHIRRNTDTLLYDAITLSAYTHLVCAAFKCTGRVTFSFARVQWKT